MPIYEYKCRGCETEFELLILPGPKSEPECPSCHKQDLELLLSAFAVSSQERSQAVFNAARKHYEKTELRDKKVAESESIAYHHH